MSDPGSSNSSNIVAENPADRGPRAHTRWPGLLILVLGWTLGPLVALWNQELIYQADMWACSRQERWPIHLVPLLCLVVTIGMGLTAYRGWKAIGAGIEDEANDVVARARFLAIGGAIISAFCALVIIAQWAAVVVFAPCMRA